ncbi:MAG: hypothetical protein O4860_12345, partial [Trichodesmium sp. St2_bin2_1]|nr:hypothetical protein [Trichodesmium sp. St2_bin2_1]
PGVDSRAERERYVADLNRRMKGLRLETSKVSSNPSRRNFAKFCESLSISSGSFLSRRRFRAGSNAGLGKLSQDDVKSSSKYVNTWQEVVQTRSDPRFCFKRLEVITSTLAEVVYEPRQELMGPHKNTQVVLPAGSRFVSG